LVLALMVGGCAAPPGREDDRQKVLHEVRERAGADGHPVDLAALAGGSAISEAQAVDLALLNNAAFREQLAELKLTDADLIAAGLIANPDLVVLIPVGPKQLEATLTAPLESLWLRGRRIEAANAAADRTLARLTQAGLDLVRDVRLAFAELDSARRRLALLEEAAALRERVAELAQARVQAGDAAPLDAATSKIEALRSAQDAKSAAHAERIAQERLRALLGAGRMREDIKIATADEPAELTQAVDALVEGALADRPDVRAAALAVTAAQQRARLARLEWFGFSFVIDMNERGSKGVEVGPGFKFTIPLFNQGQGTIARADAEVERAAAQQKSLHDRIILEVREAHARYVQSRDDLVAWRTQIVPATDDAVKLARKAYENGETPLVQVLDLNRQLLEASARQTQAELDLRRAAAELERSVGRRLDSLHTMRKSEAQP
jgi:cobalt-zinc-cadmium efflux system outer membrane protein